MCPDSAERPTPLGLGDLLAGMLPLSSRGRSSFQADPAATLDAIAHVAMGLLCARYGVTPSHDDVKTFRALAQAAKKKQEQERRANRIKKRGRPLGSSKVVPDEDVFFLDVAEELLWLRGQKTRVTMKEIFENLEKKYEAKSDKLRSLYNRSQHHHTLAALVGRGFLPRR